MEGDVKELKRSSSILEGGARLYFRRHPVRSLLNLPIFQTLCRVYDSKMIYETRYEIWSISCVESISLRISFTVVFALGVKPELRIISPMADGFAKSPCRYTLQVQPTRIHIRDIEPSSGTAIGSLPATSSPSCHYICIFSFANMPPLEVIITRKILSSVAWKRG